MDWLSKRKFVIVCHEKVVRIPLEGDEILRVHGELTQGVVKTLMNTKVNEPKLSDISVVRDFIDVFPEMQELSEQLRELKKDKVIEQHMARSGTDLKMAKLVMSSPNHPTSNIEDAFSSNFPDYIPASPDYSPASPGNTYSSSSNNSFGLVPIASPTLSLFHDDPYMKVMQHNIYAKNHLFHRHYLCLHLQCYHQYLILKNSFFLRNYCHLRNEAVTDHPPLLLPYLKNLRWEKALRLVRNWARLQRKQMGNNNMIALARFRDCYLDTSSKNPRYRHQADKKVSGLHTNEHRQPGRTIGLLDY
ncbi:reverse transcriptase domain-containing protein [Tanacetum coccineum]|uniref:Reverse transcriptase domain-containing protein n=1 Tax=Tanacetum coccineum TaxID=301880 RepID=A0ABQ5B1R1_9ASTR